MPFTVDSLPSGSKTGKLCRVLHGNRRIYSKGKNNSHSAHPPASSSSPHSSQVRQRVWACDATEHFSPRGSQNSLLEEEVQQQARFFTFGPVPPPLPGGPACSWTRCFMRERVENKSGGLLPRLQSPPHVNQSASEPRLGSLIVKVLGSISSVNDSLSDG